MTGLQFYEFLRINFNRRGNPIYKNRNFVSWLPKPDKTHSFQFSIPNNPHKALPKEVIIKAWDANRLINDDWFIANIGRKFHGDCRQSMLNFFYKKYKYLRNTP